jgi:hypothetical protein
MIRYMALSGMFLSMLACNPNVDLENIAADKLLAVTCVISPQDTSFNAYVFRGSKLGSTVKPDSAAVKDALVTISDGTNYDTLYLTFDVHPITGMKSYRYTGKKRNVVVSAHSTYFLNVQAPSGEAISAHCTVPPQAGYPTLSGMRQNDDYRCIVDWTNEHLHKYFILILDADGTYENTAPAAGGRSLEIHASLSEPIQFPSDGQVAHNIYEVLVPKAYIAENPELHVTIRNINEELYKYYKSYEAYDEWQSNNYGSLFPNFREIPLIYTNVSNGAGIFSAYNQSAVTQDIF